MGLFQYLSRLCCNFFSPYHSSFYSGIENLKGLQGEVQCHFSKKGIPKIIATNEEDLFFAQGYLHAKERMWQMELTRATFRGELAGLLGKLSLEPPSVSHQLHNYSTIELDHFMKTFGLFETAKKAVPHFSKDFSSKLDAYLAGANLHIQQLQENPQLAPLEARLLKRSFKPWEAADCCSIEKLLAFQLNYSWRSLLTLNLLEAKLGEKAHPLKFGYPSHHPTMTQTTSSQLLELEESIRNFTHLGGKPLGSNAWVISGEKTTTGKPFLANDPHLSLLIPSAWYFVSLECPTLKITGASIPGSPGVVIGQNQHLAWGLTNVMADDGDLYFEELNSEGSHYLQGEDWKPLKTRKEIIEVRKGKPLAIVIRETERGPLLSDCLSHTDLHLSLKWTMHQVSNQMECFYHLLKAETKEELVASMKGFVAPAQNLMYADTQGNIGYHMIGKIPLRPGKDRGLQIQEGKNALDWNGFIPYEELPQLENPESGVLVTANQKIEDENYPYYISHFYEPAFRANRITTQLDKHNSWDEAKIATLFKDVHCLQAEEFIGKYLALVEMKDEFEEKVFQILKEWDFKLDSESVGGCIFNVWYIETIRAVLEDQLEEPLYSCYLEILHQATTPFENILAGKTSFLPNDEQQEKVTIGFHKAIEKLKNLWGNELSEWKWGRLHQLPLQHAMGKVPIFGSYLNLGPIPGEGGSMTVNNGTFSLAKPYDQLIGASFRFLGNLASLDDSGYILPGGQSGHWNSPHYGDQVELWQKGEFTFLNEKEYASTKKFLPEKK